MRIGDLIRFSGDSVTYQVVMGPLTDAFGEKTWTLRSLDDERATFRVREALIDDVRDKGEA